ncbi:MAG: ABC transporter ATP-binding protein [Acidiferrobacterales bacterium]|nr:ABC transporter ATP-binding protein [Acidiferrobacterales bacterium]
MLSVRKIDSYYGSTQVLFGMSIEVNEGEIVTLLGRNGMGKSTTIRSIMGLNETRNGTIIFQDQEITNWPAFRIAQAGLALAPEGRRIFPNLNVVENLVATASNKNELNDPWTVEKIFTLFPALEARARITGNRISGGEQQMLSIGRALMTNPRLLLLDEATEGLSPLLRNQIWSSIVQLKDNRQSILLIDKNLESLLRIGDRHYIIEKGHVVWNGDSGQLASDEELQQRYIGLGQT